MLPALTRRRRPLETLRLLLQLRIEKLQLLLPFLRVALLLELYSGTLACIGRRAQALLQAQIQLLLLIELQLLLALLKLGLSQLLLLARVELRLLRASPLLLEVQTQVVFLLLLLQLQALNRLLSRVGAQSHPGQQQSMDTPKNRQCVAEEQRRPPVNMYETRL